MNDNNSEPSENLTPESLSKQETPKGNATTRIFSIVSILLVLVATPLIITIGFLVHSSLYVVFGIWTYVTVSTLIILSVFSVYEVLKEESEKSKEKDLAALKHDLSFLFRYKHIVLPFLVLSILSLLGSIFHFFSPFFSLQLIYTAVIILVFETVFHSLYRVWPKLLKESPAARNVTLTILILLGLFVSLFVIGVSAVLLISIVFGGIVIVGGIGLAFIVDTVASDLSHIGIPNRRVSYVVLLVLFLVLVFWLLRSFNLAHLLILPTTVLGNALPIPIPRFLTTELQSLGTGLNISLISVIIALVAGTSYFVYLLFKKSYNERLERFLFLTMSIPVVGFILLYLAILADSDWTASIVAPTNPFYYFLQLLPSVVLFAVGYSQIMIEIPRRSSRALMVEENKFIVALTWLIIFAAISEFLSWSVFGQPGTFIFEVEVLQWFGLPIGIGLVAYRYVKKK